MYVINNDTELTESIRQKIYGGGLEYTPLLFIGTTRIPYTNIKSIKVSDSVIDENQEYMQLGSFVSKKLEMEFYKTTLYDEQGNELEYDLSQPIDYSIEIYDIENDISYQAPIGRFYVETAPMDFYKNAKLSALDSSIKFKQNIDIHQFFKKVYDTSDITVSSEFIDLTVTTANEITGETTSETIKGLDLAFDTISGAIYQISYATVPQYIGTFSDENTILSEGEITYPAEGITYETDTNGTMHIIYFPVDETNKDEINELISSVEVTQSILLQDDIDIVSLLESICDYCQTPLKSYPNVNNDIRTAFYDNTISAKQYISYIAEIMGGYAKITRDDKLIIVPAKSGSTVKIDATKGKSFTNGDIEIIDDDGNTLGAYEIGRVRYDNGMLEKHYPTGTETEIDTNVLTIRPDNIFVNGTEEEMQEVINAIGEAVIGLKISRITAENYADFTLDSYDIVTYTLDDESYLTYYCNEYEFKGSIMSKVNVSIPTKQVEETTNTVSNELLQEYMIRSIQTTVNQQEATMTTIAKRTTTLENSGFVTLEQVQFEIAPDRAKITATEETIENGVPKVNAEGFIFDNTGLHLARKDENDNYIGNVRSDLTEKSFDIVSNLNDETILYAGYDETTGETIVETQNTTVHNYLRLDTVGRWQNYYYQDNTSRSGIDNTTRTGFFWTYGEEED